ncbi:putative phage holin [Streptomyces griseus]|uniref:putative phage holin n=1 Tax=Streptomyces griseus TaxID=1911 RepID=UPI0037AA7549
MSDLGPDQLINVSMSALAFLACAVFATVYHSKAPWWRSSTGWNLMGFAGAVGLLCLYTVLITLWPEGCPAAVLRSIRTAVLLAMTVLMIQRTRMVIRAQRHNQEH